MLREKLLERQRELGLRDGEMAARLDVPRTSYNNLKTGKYRVSMAMAKRIIAVFPDLAQYALADDPPAA